MPTTRLGKVYRLLKTQKAHIVSYEPFTIQLDYEPDTQVIQPMTLGADSGAIHSGYSVANEHREYYSAEVIARNDISNRLSDRRMYRQSRRSRKTRYRQPRFKNRKNKKTGWLPPSLEQKVAVQVNEIDHLHRYFPIETIIVEVAEFDIQKIKNPDITGIEYQQGTLQGYNIRNYLLEKHGRKCFYCGKAVSDFEVEHMFPKSKVVLIALINGYITKYNRIQAGLPKAHYIDAKCITGFSTVPPMSQTVVKVKMRRHNRQLHRATFSKGHVRKVACLPTVTFGFQLYDLVLFDNHRYYIKSRRSSGIFALASVEGLKNEERTYKKLTLLAHTNAYLTNRYVNV